MDWSVVFTTTLVYAAVFAVVFCVILFGGLLVAPDSMVHDYPQPIQDRYGPKSPRGERAGRIMNVFMALLMIGVVIGGVVTLKQRLGGDIGFWPGFVFGTLLFVLLNVFDLVVIDWWLFAYVRPRILVLPGTEDMPEYGDWLYHLKVLVPMPVPWPLLLIPGYGAVVGLATVAVEALW